MTNANESMGGAPDGEGPIQVVIHNHPVQTGWVRRWFVRAFLFFSILANIVLFVALSGFVTETQVWERFRDGDATAGDKIAVIPIKGVITSDTARIAAKELRRAADDSAVKAVLLEIDTPGGTLSGSDELYHAVLAFKERSNRGKPVVAFMKGMATSGGYYVAVASDQIIAERSCVTGSIGVIMNFIHGEKLLDKIGVTSDAIKSGPMKDAGSMYRAMSDAERQEWQRLVDGMYRQFLDVVLKHRGAAIGGEEKLKPLADGRVVSAAAALSAKLIDAIGYEDDAFNTAKRLAGLTEKVRIVEYGRPTASLTSLLFGMTAAPTPDWKKAAAALTPQLLLMPNPSAASAGLLEGLVP